jgi:hypothetical protein
LGVECAFFFVKGLRFFIGGLADFEEEAGMGCSISMPKREERSLSSITLLLGCGVVRISLVAAEAMSWR